MYKSLSWGKYPKAHKKRISSAREYTSLKGKNLHFYLSTRLCKWHNHIHTHVDTHTYTHFYFLPMANWGLHEPLGEVFYSTHSIPN